MPFIILSILLIGTVIEVDNTTHHFAAIDLRTEFLCAGFSGSIKGINATVTTEIKHQGGVATSDDTNFRMFHESTATVAIEKNDTSVNYEKQNILIENERIGDFIAVKTINALLPDGTKWILHFGVYKISDIDMEEAVAVRFVTPFGFTQGYFMFTDPNYNKADNTLINDS